MARTHPTGTTGYLAPRGFMAQLAAELGEVELVHERLLLAGGPPRQCAWAQNVWFDPVRIEIESIKDAARALRALQRGWALLPTDGLHRRGQLIQDQLPHVSSRPLAFGDAPPAAPLGSWTLLQADVVLASPACSSPFPHGEVSFVEDRTGMPNRAYLKLWELFTRIGVAPGQGQLCLDLGASPGGWTAVLAGLGAHVISVDRAPLDPTVAAMPGVEERRESAFGIAPESLGTVDWLFSDVVCYPERLLALVRRWLESGTCRNFVCTIKFQGATDHEIARRFHAIPGSQLVHLCHNKHELTWVKVTSDRSGAPPGAHRLPRPSALP